MRKMNLFSCVYDVLFCTLQFEMVEKDEETESKDVKRNPEEQKQQTPRGSSSSTSNSSWLTSGEGWWLGLASPQHSLDKSNQG